jgi:hypothetical protein
MKTFVALLPVIIALSLIYTPQFWVCLCIIIDFSTDWEIFLSSTYDSYHKFLVGRLPDREEIPLQEIHWSEASGEKVKELTRGFTYPVIIRGLLGESDAVKFWNDPEWWMKNYPNEEVLCSKRGIYLSDQVDNCTISTWYNQLYTDDPYYIVGATSIFDNNPELHTMVNSPHIDAIEPGPRMSTQMFMGLPGQGSDIHCAAGVNM